MPEKKFCWCTNGGAMLCVYCYRRRRRSPGSHGAAQGRDAHIGLAALGAGRALVGDAACSHLFPGHPPVMEKHRAINAVHSSEWNIYIFPCHSMWGPEVMWQAPANRMQQALTSDLHSVFLYGKWAKQRTNTNYTPYLPGEAHVSGHPSSCAVNVTLTHT